MVKDAPLTYAIRHCSCSIRDKRRASHCSSPTLVHNLSQSSISTFATGYSNKTKKYTTYQYSARRPQQLAWLKQQKRESQSPTVAQIVQKIEHLDGRRKLFSEWLEFVVTSRSETRQLVDETGVIAGDRRPVATGFR